MKLPFFLFEKSGQNLSVRVMRNTEINCNGLRDLLIKIEQCHAKLHLKIYVMLIPKEGMSTNPFFFGMTLTLRYRICEEYSVQFYGQCTVLWSVYSSMVSALPLPKDRLLGTACQFFWHDNDKDL